MVGLLDLAGAVGLLLLLLGTYALLSALLLLYLPRSPDRGSALLNDVLFAVTAPFSVVVILVAARAHRMSPTERLRGRL